MISFRVWGPEVTSFISGNHKPSHNMFFKTAVCQMSLSLSLTRNTSIKLYSLSL